MPPHPPTTMAPATRSLRRLKDAFARQDTIWPAIAALIAVLAVPGVFTLSKVFFYRDLSSDYWPHHIWLRDAIRSGTLSLWEPRVGLGLPILDDPSYQLLFLPSLALRLLLPEVLAFNLGVLFPVPVAAIGSYLLIRRRASPRAAALGAVAFAASGPFLSIVNCYNLPAALAFMPWVLWGVDRTVERPTARRIAGTSTLVGLQVFAGHPETVLSTGVLALAYAICLERTAAEGWTGRVRAAAVVVSAGTLGAMLAAIQLVPLVAAVRASERASGLLQDGWAIHPLRLVEFVAPTPFGSPVDTLAAWSPWIEALNDGREPVVGSLYIGVMVAILAVLGAAAGPRRWTVFWGATAAVAVVLALGEHTPVYPLLREYVPPLQFVRFPSKFLFPGLLGVAVLAATGWDAVERAVSAREKPSFLRAPFAVGGALAVAAAAVVLLLVLAPDAVAATLSRLAEVSGVADPHAGAAYLLRSSSLVAPRLLGLTGGTLVLVWLVTSGREAARFVPALCFAIVAIDLIATNAPLNPTISARTLEEPDWVAVVRARPEGRVFVTPSGSEFGPSPFAMPPDTMAAAASAITAAVFTTYPAAWGLSEAISHDVRGLRPREYARAVHQFRRSDATARSLFLRRAGVRYHLVAAPPFPEARALVTFDKLPPFALYEDPGAAPRFSLVTGYAVQPDIDRQVSALFDAGFPFESGVLLERAPPPPAGAPGQARQPEVVVTHDGASVVEARVGVPAEGAFLLMTDIYDPDWRVEVDGNPAPLLRADGLFRAVRLAPGSHTVRFAYGPRPVAVGLALSVVTLAALLLSCWWSARRSNEPVHST